jgi:citrate lyase subunit beta/citryl-CoA lyase
MIRPRRTVLYVPASNARAIEKSRKIACDAVILDLEDAVAPDLKLAAREAALATLRILSKSAD